MGLYNTLLGVSPLAPLILGILEKSVTDFGRFRDAYTRGDRLIVMTRCGGGNRNDYQPVFEAMRQHPLFIEARDDSYDSTYCEFQFRFPSAAEVPQAIIDVFGDDFPEMLTKLGKLPPMPSFRERWEAMISSLGKDVK